MSVIDLAVAKGYLDVIHSADDVKLQMLLDGAEDEARSYMDRPSLSGPWGGGGHWPDSEASSSNGDSVPAGVVMGVMLLLQAMYQASPDEIPKLRAAAEVKLAPYRLNWGA